MNEATFEAAVFEALRRAFPTLHTDDLRLQTRFSLKLGHLEHEVTASARGDVAIWRGETPLAMLELKKPGTILNSGDESQALSYALLTRPPMPLTILTNGTDAGFFESYSGRPLPKASDFETIFAQAITSTARIAEGDIRSAISTLLGTNEQVWIEAVRMVSEETIAEQTGKIEEYRQPFASDFQIHRRATVEVISALRSGKRAVLLSGAPLSGKSSVLREMVQLTADDDALVVLYIDGDSGDNGVFRQLANVFSKELGWTADTDDVRTWVRRVSMMAGAKLVIAIDGISPSHTTIRRDVEEMIGHTYGDNVGLVLAVDDAIVDTLMTADSKRKETALGRAAELVLLGRLDNKEFGGAMIALSKTNRVSFMKGAEFSSEYRIPWMLRSVIAPITSYLRQTPGAGVFVPPLIGLDLFRHTRQRFSDDLELAAIYDKLARALVFETRFKRMNPALDLRRLSHYAVQRDVANGYMSSDDREELIRRRLLRSAVLAGRQQVYLPRLPEVLAVCLADVLSEELDAAEDIVAAIDSLLATTTGLRFGDLIAAEAIRTYILRREWAPYDIINALLAHVPTSEPVQTGKKAFMELDDGSLLDLEFTATSVIVRSGGQTRSFTLGPNEKFINDMEGWLALSHLASQSMAAQSADGQEYRPESEILLRLGQAPVVLRRPHPMGDLLPIPVHEHEDTSIICGHVGIIEPIGMAILAYLDRKCSEASPWIEAAEALQSPPLLQRIVTALTTMCEISHPASEWAQLMLSRLIEP